MHALRRWVVSFVVVWLAIAGANPATAAQDVEQDNAGEEAGQMNAHPGDGYHPSLYGCWYSDVRVAPHDGWSTTASIYFQTPDGQEEYKGWVEWRYSSECGHYQWAAIHVTDDIEHHVYFETYRLSDGKRVVDDWESFDAPTNPKFEYATRETKMLWARDSLLCLDIQSDTSAEEGFYYINAAEHNSNGDGDFCG